MKLIIAEKPMLARAIADAIDGSAVQKNGYTEKGDYDIISAFGHLLTLKDPEDYDIKYKKWSLDTLPIYFDDWGKKPCEGKEERLDQIGKLIKDAECVIHAGDPDDEGQYLIDEIIRWFGYEGPVYRLSTGDTTKAALKKALANMKDNREFENSGWSAHARSVADMMVGYNFSRFFTLKNPQVKMLTVGRVQTPALGLVVARDMAIENHKKQSYFTVKAKIDIDGKVLEAVFEPAKDSPYLTDGRLSDESYVSGLTESLKGKELKDISVSRKEITEQPPLPFNLVKLQTYCSGKFGYDPSKTLEITQRLRDEHNAITYNRSDCQYLSEEQYKEAPATVAQIMDNLKNDPAGRIFGSLPTDLKLHSKAFDDDNITAHTAIIPQNRRFDVSKLSEEERNVYLAIMKYFIAQFLPPAKKERSNLEAAIEGGMLKAVSTKILSPGYMQLIRPEKNKDDEDEEESENDLSLIEPGTYDGKCTDAWSEAKETKAPSRYTKATLNEDMTRIAKYVTDPKAKELLLAKDKDKKGENGSIGTSATRSGIIDTLEQRGYIVSKGKSIQSTGFGRELYRILPEELKKPDMTGYWWAVQEEIQDGQVPWTNLTDSVLEMIKNVVSGEYPTVDAYLVPETLRRGKISYGNCPRCGEPVIEGERGFGCSGYKKGCRFVIWKKAPSGMMQKTTVTGDMVHQWLSGEWTEEIRKTPGGEEIRTGRRRSANTVAVKKLYSESKKSTYSGMVYITDDGNKNHSAGFGIQELVKEEPKVLGKCPRCGRDVLEVKNGYGCSGYRDGCKFIIWKDPNQKFLSKVSFTKTDAKNFLAGKSVKKKKLVDKKGREFSAMLVMEETPDNPYGPVFRVLEGTVEAKEGSPEDIRIDTVPMPGTGKDNE